MTNVVPDPIIISLIDRSLKGIAINHAKNKGDERLVESLANTNGFAAYNIVTLIHGEPPRAEK